MGRFRTTFVLCVIAGCYGSHSPIVETDDSIREPDSPRGGSTTQPGPSSTEPDGECWEADDATALHLDLLLVLDRSDSMRTHQNLVTHGIARFVRTLLLDPTIPHPASIRIGTIGTDPNSGGGHLQSPVRYFCADDERDGPWLQMPSRSIPNVEELENHLRCVRFQEPHGSPIEQPLETLRRTFDGRGPGPESEFFREEAIPIILMVTDEDDCSVAPSASSTSTRDRCEQRIDLHPIERYLDWLSSLDIHDRLILIALGPVAGNDAGDEPEPTTRLAEFILGSNAAVRSLHDIDDCTEWERCAARYDVYHCSRNVSCAPTNIVAPSLSEATFWTDTRELMYRVACPGVVVSPPTPPPPPPVESHEPAARYVDGTTAADVFAACVENRELSCWGQHYCCDEGEPEPLDRCFAAAPEFCTWFLENEIDPQTRVFPERIREHLDRRRTDARECRPDIVGSSIRDWFEGTAELGESCDTETAWPTCAPELICLEQDHGAFCSERLGLGEPCNPVDWPCAAPLTCDAPSWMEPGTCQPFRDVHEACTADLQCWAFLCEDGFCAPPPPELSGRSWCAS